MNRHRQSPDPPAAPEGTIKSFGPNHIIEPRSEHTHTAIVLHGRGSDAEEFAEEFLASTLSNGRTVCDELPGWRWVFPCSKELWSTAFQEDMPAWFEAHSLTDPTTQQDLQVDGLRDSVDHVSRIMEEEIQRLGGYSQRVVLGGISQGGAVAIWTLLCQRDETKRLGGFFAASTWLPFAAEVKEFAAGQDMRSQCQPAGGESASPKDVVLRMLPPDGLPSFLPQIPVFMGHGTDDAYVDVELGREATDVLRRGGWKVELKEYVGAEEEGHWFKVPDEMDDIYGFLTKLTDA